MTLAAKRIEITDPERAADGGAFMPKPLRCVLMDDNRFDRIHLRDVAAKSSYEIEVIETSTIAETRTALEGGEADFLFLDHKVPDGNGIEFARQMAKDVRLSAIPVIVVTGARHESVIIDALRAGAADYICKEDLNNEVFDQAVENALQRSRVASVDQAAMLSNLRAENETLRRIALRNMRLLKGQTMPLLSFAWRTLRGDVVSEDERKRAAKGLGKITRNLTGLIDDTVITAAMHRANETEQPVDLNEVMDTILRDDLGEIAASRAHVRVGSLPILSAREEQMTMLFEELLLSAIRCGRFGQVPEIDISAGRDPEGNPIIVFRENGLRLSARKQSISDRFGDIGAPPDDNVRDELSWSLCQRLVEKNGGQFRIAENTDNGSKVMMRFPASRLARDSAHTEVEP